MALCTRHVPAREIARNIGISRTVLYKWKDEIIGDEAYQSMRKHKGQSAMDKEIASGYNFNDASKRTAFVAAMFFYVVTVFLFIFLKNMKI